MLKKIPLRVMLRNKMHFGGIILLLMLAVFTFTLFETMIVNVDGNYQKFKKEGNQEHFNFITVRPVDLEEIESDFNVVLEKRIIWDYEEDGKTLRIFSITEKVNRPYVLNGRLPEDGEICIDKTFMDANGLEVGDSYEVKGKKFRISGYLYLPDYVYIVKNEQDILPDPKNFGIAILSNNDIEELGILNVQAAVNYYSGRKTGEVDLTEFQKYLNEKYMLVRFQESWDNFRIITTEMKMKGAGTFTVFLTGVIFVIASGLLLIILKRQLDLMHEEIGTLYALGYRQGEIAIAFFNMPLVIWILGTVPGILLGYATSKPFIDYYASWFNIPVARVEYPLNTALIAAALPAAFLFVAAAVAIYGKFRMSVVEIISGRQLKAAGRGLRLSFLEKLSFKRRLMIEQGLLHPTREAILIIGVAFSSFLLFYAVGALFAFENLLSDIYEKTFLYDHMYLLNKYKMESPPKGAERFNMISFRLKGEDSKLVIYGIEKDSRYVVLNDGDGNRIKLEGVVISRALADKFNLKEGDEIEIVSQLSGEEYKIKIDKIAELYYGNSAFMNLEEFNKKFNIPDLAYIGLYSKEPLEIEKSELLTSMDKSYLIDVFNSTTAQMNQIIQIIAMVAFLISLTIIYVLSSLTISENRYPISLFKILGYRDSELTSIFLGFSNFTFVIGFLLGIPIFNLFFRVIYMQLIKSLDFSINMSLGTREISLSFALLFVAFLISRYLCKRSVLKIQPSIVLKEQRE